MLRYTIRRLLLLIATMFFGAVIVFFLAHAAPGSPLDAKAQGDKNLPTATILKLEEHYGLNRPVTEQFVLYMESVVKFDFGNSFRSGRAVSDIIGDGFPVSAQLGIQALLVALAFALPLGVISALRQNSATDSGERPNVWPPPSRKNHRSLSAGSSCAIRAASNSAFARPSAINVCRAAS